MVETDGIYVSMGIGFDEYEMEVDLIPLELNDFNVILGIDWLSKHKAQIDYYTKTITFQGLGSRRMVFGGEITTISINLVSAVPTRKLLTKGYMGYLAYILNSDKDETKIRDILVVKEFSYVFPEKLPGLPLDREVEVSINTFLEVLPIAQPLYRTTLTELNELKIQLQELLDKRFI
jgi:hypothetical protein